MKRVLIFSLAYFPKHVGGAEVAIKEITNRIDPSEIEFHMVTNRYDSTLPREERIGTVIMHRIGITTREPSMADLKRWPLNLNKMLFQFSAALAAHRLHRQYHFDATWAMMAHSCGVPAAIFKIIHPKVPFILTLQEGDPIDYIERKMRPLWPFFSRAFTSADVVQAISTFLGSWARARGFTGPLEIIPNGVDIARFTAEYPHEEIAAIQTKLGKHSGDIFLITTSRLVEKNAVDDVISALTLLPETVKFAILGTGPLEKKLKRQVAEHRLESRVLFLGQIDHDEMPKYLKACDIFIRPSRSEGMGNSFIEAMAAGLPVIATQEGGLSDFIFDAQRNPEREATAWVVDRDAPQEIAEAVRGILAHPEQAGRMVEVARTMAQERYSWDLIARLMRTKVFGQVSI